MRVHCTRRHPIDPSRYAYFSQLVNTHIYTLKRSYQTLCAYEDKARNFGLKHWYFPVHALNHIDIIIHIYIYIYIYIRAIQYT